MHKNVLLLTICILLAVVFSGCQKQDASAAYQATLNEYDAYNTALRGIRIVVTEKGLEVGRYSLEDLHLKDKAQRAVNAYFDTATLTDQDSFTGNPWYTAGAQNVTYAPVRLPHMVPDTAAVWEDLDNSDRTPSANAHLERQGSRYTVVPEVNGNALNISVVNDAFSGVLANVSIDPSRQTSEYYLELTDCDCYPAPTVTADNFQPDYAAALARDTANMTISVDFDGQTETLDAAAVDALLSVDSSGAIQTNGEALDAKIAAWEKAYNGKNVPYRFASQANGIVELKKQICSYKLDAAALRAALQTQLLSFESGALTADIVCTDAKGNPFSIGDTYVEVDITNQKLYYFLNGEKLVDTDVVTGKANGHDTPTGVYTVTQKLQDRWLLGEDYKVFVQYWIRFYGGYGLHDAAWRSKFGGDRYIYGGSHGCVNIPTDAVATVYNNIELGTYVILY